MKNYVKHLMVLGKSMLIAANYKRSHGLPFTMFSKMNMMKNYTS